MKSSLLIVILFVIAGCSSERGRLVQSKSVVRSPLSVVQPPPALVTNTLNLTWDLPDDPANSGIEGVNLYVSTNQVDWYYLGTVRFDSSNPTNLQATFIDQRKRIQIRYFMARSFAGKEESEPSNIARYPKWSDVISGYLISWIVPATADVQETLEFSDWQTIGTVTNGTNYFIAASPAPAKFWRLNGTPQPLTISTVMVNNPLNK